MTLRTALAAVAAAALVATPLLAQDAKPKAGSAAQSFVTKAANGGMLEVESSEMAIEKAKRDDVKSFARTMVEDHGKANQALEAAAEKAGATVPAKMDKQHQAQLDKLRSTGADRFDQAYVDLQVNAHRDAVALFKGYSKTGDNAELKSFATTTLPTLEQHEAMAKELKAAKPGAGAVGKSSGTGREK